MYEEYDKISDAQKFYTQIKAANAKNNVLKDLAMGDEAYSQDDTVHLRFIMARKGNKILRFKINKVTRWTSTDGLMDVARMMSSKL
jgi:hypothetical protein